MIVVPPVHSSGSPAALELAQKISNAISEYQQTHPGVSTGDIREAMRIVQTNTGTGTNRRIGVMVAAVVSILIAVGLMPTFSHAGHVHDFMMPWVLIVIVGGVFAIAMKARR